MKHLILGLKTLAAMALVLFVAEAAARATWKIEDRLEK